MNEQLIVTVYGVIDDLLKTMGHASDPRAGVSDAEVLTWSCWPLSEVEGWATEPHTKDAIWRGYFDND